MVAYLSRHLLLNDVDDDHDLHGLLHAHDVHDDLLHGHENSHESQTGLCQ